MDIRTNLNLSGGARINGLPASVEAGQPVTHEQLASVVENLAWKGSVRVASPANVNLAAPGPELDGFGMGAGDRFLAPTQDDPTTNGIYVWNGANVPATRAPDANTAQELLAAIVPVQSGTSAGANYRQSAVNINVGVTPLTFEQYGTSAPPASINSPGIVRLGTQQQIDDAAADRAVTGETLNGWRGRVRRMAGPLGDGFSTQIAITHNFGTRDVSVEVYRNGGNYDTVLCDISRSDENTVRFNFQEPQGNAALRFVILA